jgi:hypothetical protein
MACRIFFPEETAKIGSRVDCGLRLFVDGNVAIKVAPLLREASRDLRARSETLRAKNRNVMEQATAVAVKYYVSISGNCNSAIS